MPVLNAINLLEVNLLHFWLVCGKRFLFGHVAAKVRTQNLRRDGPPLSLFFFYILPASVENLAKET